MKDLSLLTSIMPVFVFSRLEPFRLLQDDTKVNAKLFITRYQINFLFLIFLMELRSSKCNVSGVFANLSRVQTCKHVDCKICQKTTKI